MNINLKIARIEKGLNQYELAALVGLTNQTISEYERGRRKPTYDNMKKIADALDSKVGILFFGE